MPNREEILKQIRVMGRGTRGASPAIIGLADSALYQVFEQMLRGLSNRSIARHLRKCGLTGSENSLQQSVSLFRKRIALLLSEESAPLSLPQAALKIPAEVSCLPADEMLSTVMDIVKAYGESIRQATVTAAKNGTPLSEDLSKHVKSYAALVATKARLEQTVMKQGGALVPPEDRSLDELSKSALDFIGDDGDKMVKASQKFLLKLAEKCISLERGADGEWVEAPRHRPGRRGGSETAHDDSSAN
ncbi:MAG: hypothetical protein ACLP5H_13485 [Desulfomonilaceae bacterium]